MNFIEFRGDFRFKKQLREESEMILVEIDDQTIIGPFKIDEGVRVNNAERVILKTGLSLYDTRSRLAVSK